MSRKNMRNPMERTATFENPAGNVMQELSEIELDKVTGGIDYVSNANSCGFLCTITGECQGTANFLCCD
ncbi:MAG: plantaricin C family lantibiotic [Lachnospiraceae bacterium]|nr:plantaricin C family lantibiotic [Lachnospiraceae bacterium]MDE7202688.1 plantaricin C family lantibiotic [Lachnospiraceae bacterium]